MATDMSGADTALAFHPMDQFVIKPLFRHIDPGSCLPAEGLTQSCVRWYEPTNATLFMAIIFLAVVGLMVWGTRGRGLVPNRLQSIAELTYGMVYKMVEDVSGPDGVKYFPYVLSLFLFIIFANLLGLVPRSFTVTSHIAVTAVLALAVFFTVTAIGFARNGTAFLKLFWVDSAPLVLRPILALIEVISYFVRPVSHSIRLAGNMLAGHAVIKVFAGFAAVILLKPALGVLVTPLSVLAITAVYALEVMVAVVQAYVFTILTCVYLKDALHPQH